MASTFATTSLLDERARGALDGPQVMKMIATTLSHTDDVICFKNANDCSAEIHEGDNAAPAGSILRPAR